MDGQKRCKNARVDKKFLIRFQETEKGGFRKRFSSVWCGQGLNVRAVSKRQTNVRRNIPCQQLKMAIWILSLFAVQNFALFMVLG